MKRDMDLIRAILLQLEEKAVGVGSFKLDLPDYDDAQIGYHCTLLIEAGLALGIDTKSMRSTHPEWKMQRLTWTGHEFLDASREPTRWQKAKDVASKAGGLTLGMFAEVLRQLMLEQVNEYLG